jgi:hypothetical protein
MMRLGDYVIVANLTLNLTALSAYAYQGHWKMAGYWFAVLQLNAWLVTMR